MGTWGTAGDRGKNSLFQPTKKMDRGRHGDLGRGWEQREEFSLIPTHKEKWTEAGMGTWGGAWGKREEFSLIPSNKESGQRKAWGFGEG